MVSTTRHRAKAAAALGFAAASLCSSKHGVVDAFYSSSNGAAASSSGPLAFVAQPWPTRSPASHQSTAVSLSATGRARRLYVRDRGCRGGFNRAGDGGVRSERAAAGVSVSKAAWVGAFGARRGANRSSRGSSTELFMVPSEDAGSSSTSAVSGAGALWCLGCHFVIFVAAAAVEQGIRFVSFCYDFSVISYLPTKGKKSK